MKPVSNWDQVGRGYHFKEKTWYSTYHLGLDLMTPAWTPLYAPFNGTSTSNGFTEGGNVIDYRANGLVFRFMHLAKITKTGACNEGDLIGYTGNSGTLTTGAHLHVDISRGSVQVNNINNFIDPETFAWGEGGLMSAEFDALNQKISALYGIVDVTNHAVDNLSVALTGIQSTLKQIAASEALQDPQIQKAIKDSQEAIKVAQSAPQQLSDTQVASVAKVSGLFDIIKSWFNK